MNGQGCLWHLPCPLTHTAAIATHGYDLILFQRNEMCFDLQKMSIGRNNIESNFLVRTSYRNERSILADFSLRSVKTLFLDAHSRYITDCVDAERTLNYFI